MLGGLGKGLLMRLASYAVLVLGFLLLFRAFENSNILVGVAGGVAVLAAMWLMVGFRSPSWSFRPKTDSRDPENQVTDESQGRRIP